MEFPSLSQDEDEFFSLLSKVAHYETDSILEIGIWRGGSLARIANYLRPRILVGIDPAMQLERWNPQWGEVHFLAGESQDESIRRQALEIAGGKFDFIHIDGNHIYEMARLDFEWSLANCRNIIAIHDIMVTNNPEIGVWKLWAEIKSGLYKGINGIEQIVSQNSPYGYGVIIL